MIWTAGVAVTAGIFTLDPRGVMCLLVLLVELFSRFQRRWGQVSEMHSLLFLALWFCTMAVSGLLAGNALSLGCRFNLFLLLEICAFSLGFPFWITQGGFKILTHLWFGFAAWLHGSFIGGLVGLVAGRWAGFMCWIMVRQLLLSQRGAFEVVVCQHFQAGL